MNSAPSNCFRVAVIDIGSNASRLLLARGTPEAFAVEMFVRAPLPLGAETFGENRQISDETAARLGLTLIGFRALILAQDIRAWGAFATAALREAQNCDAVAKDIRDKTDIPIRILSGRDEAEIVGRHVARQFPNAGALICADIGGGSSDAAFIQNGRVKSAASFRVGTNRADPNQHPREFARMEKWLADKAPQKPVAAVVGRAAAQAAELCGQLSVRNLKAWRKKIENLPAGTVALRFGMEPDRAQSAGAAASLYQFILESCGAQKLHVAAGGLPQALAARMMREQVKKGKRKQ